MAERKKKNVFGMEKTPKESNAGRPRELGDGIKVRPNSAWGIVDWWEQKRRTSAD